jgi:hypothetical protein
MAPGRTKSQCCGTGSDGGQIWNESVALLVQTQNNSARTKRSTLMMSGLWRLRPKPSNTPFLPFLTYVKLDAVD